MAQAGNSVEDIIRFQAERGDFGPVDDIERVVKERRAMMLTPGGVRYDRKTVSGRHLEFNYKPLADGGLLGVHRDITELKEREEAVEQARSVMQSVLDNMSDGVTLFDADFRLKFTNQRLDRLSPAAARGGRAGRVAAATSCASRPSAAISARSRRPRSWRARASSSSPSRAALFRAAHRPTAGISNSDFIPLPNGDTIAVTRDITELKDREEALAASKEAAEAAATRSSARTRSCRRCSTTWATASRCSTRISAGCSAIATTASCTATRRT